MQTLGLVSLVVRDYDEAIAFYVGVLGFTLASADKIKLLIGGFNSWSTSQVISPFGAQCAPTLGRLREDARKPRATLELPLRYGPLRGAG